MTTAQPSLPADYPEPLPKAAPARRRSEDYETWVAVARPIFETVAATGRRFTSFEVADEHELPDPPKPKSQWGTFIRSLADDNLIEHVGYDDTVRPGGRHSGVKVWRGTATRRRREQQAQRRAA